MPAVPRPPLIARLLPGLFAIFASVAAQAAAPAPSFDPRQTFAPLTLPTPVNRYRSANGAPGPDYWQNRADYQINARLDTQTQQLSADETITYTNNSPDTLQGLWLQIEQNIYKPGSRSSFASGWRRKPDQVTDGYQFDKVEVEYQGKRYAAQTVISDSRMQVRLAEPLPGKGSKLELHIVYHYEFPGTFGGRTAWLDTPNGRIYDVAQWYPRMAVYDDVRGWDTQPYLGSEFYLEYGDFDYRVTVPSDMVVAGAGELVNPGEVLSSEQQQRLKQARASNQTVMIRTPADVEAAAQSSASGEKTWHFRMKNTRDAVFAASKAFVWDAARINLPDHKTSIAMSFYPVESSGNDKWGRSTEYLKDSVENYSKRWFVYPYPAAINVGGPVGGMEYPGILFDHWKSQGKQLFWITAHEIGHAWFPMIVGSNERRDAWMDEGINTFIDTYESDDFNHGEFAPKRDAEYAPGGGAPADEIEPILEDQDAPPPMLRADAISEKYRHPISYFKAAYGLVLLREQILGPERFDWAFRKYIADWAYKHPTPSDFFRAMDSAGGEDLGWFWRGWFFNNWTLDLAVGGIDHDDKAPDEPVVVHIVNRDQLVLPATVRIDFADGTHRDVRLPVETWLQKKDYALHLPASPAVARVTIDPDHLIPDRDRSNNVYIVGKATK
ncbi:M1 family metallopeptidase [Solimonas sp. C16B3]|uniref:M1 family metallopeptidase n=1 Tax=Solimonas marina TaxID=2714601 RepID=A0A969WA53_9GAMM|nr:M1 family metallopeptidase [Solimonas marina]NKF22369.1 M1 family metallopeptidase [Solimonas marina]